MTCVACQGTIKSVAVKGEGIHQSSRTTTKLGYRSSHRNPKNLRTQYEFAPQGRQLACLSRSSACLHNGKDFFILADPRIHKALATLLLGFHKVPGSQYDATYVPRPRASRPIIIGNTGGMWRHISPRYATLRHYNMPRRPPLAATSFTQQSISWSQVSVY